MERRNVDVQPECVIEILPPVRQKPAEPDTVTCPCCRRVRAISAMDDDGCGICDECLEP
jgi:hypothetical protein